MRNIDTHAATLPDVLIMTAICFGWFILASVQAVAAGFPERPFSDGSFFQLMILEMILAGAAVAYLRARRHDLALLIPRPTWRGCAEGVGLYFAASLLSWLFVLMWRNHPATPEPIERMVEAASFSLWPLLSMSVVNGLYEEVFLVGYLQRAMELSGPWFALGASLLVRVLYHLYQGPMGTISVLGFGLILGIYFLMTKRLWPLVVAHVCADVSGFLFA